MDERITDALPARFPGMPRWSERSPRSDGRRRAILALGILLCVLLAVLGAFLLGWLDQFR
ncbi:hypothetical protein [Teichococcus oryzae]|uniref:Uncharacterized protein n=1 Tax=Teichococcus oryzae TaxID=1608942 RepID=A0A5B2TBW6_9PROT|nr:hypothetical protein [Pseudoroseomonas oryzae]KAA2211996.1 hypothetical protein F0Q34_16895 [Pseudoroseomonas oryzae]